MTRKVYHVTERDGEWRVKRVGARRAAHVCSSKAAAVSLAKSLAKRAPLGQVIVHGDNGRLQTEYTYGKDPRRTRG